MESIPTVDICGKRTIDYLVDCLGKLNTETGKINVRAIGRNITKGVNIAQILNDFCAQVRSSNINKLKIKKLLEEYTKLMPLYKDFSLAVKFILETILKNNQFKYQIVSCREKSIASLERKFREDPKVEKLKLNSVQEIDDLAGCRVCLLYTSPSPRD